MTSWPASFAAFSTAAEPAEHDQVGERDPLAAGCAALNSCWIRSRVCSTVAELVGLVDLPAALRLQADPGAVGAAALVGAAEARRGRPRGGDQLRDGEPGVEELRLEGGDVGVADQLVVDGRHRVLPQLRLGHPRAEVARDRAHVAVQQLVPGLGERAARTRRGARGSAARSSRTPGRRAAPGRWSASSAGASSTRRTASGMIASASLATHCLAPAGLSVSSHS